ncbi:MAG: biotin--[acetyl-CoA-carboxylase] ligase [Erythrobacter sp.]
MIQSASITIVDKTGSTNADLAEAIRNGQARENDWFIARRQTAGRGRQGREWFDGSGNFMGSTVVALDKGDPPPATLSFVTALAVSDAVGGVLPPAITADLKWPNDVLIDGGKLSGVLLEMVGSAIVVGIGVNLARAPDLPDRKTASLAQYGISPAPDAFAQVLADAFARRLTEWREDGLAAILRRFLARSLHTEGAIIAVHDTDGSRIEGAFAGLEETDGALRLRLADGSERVIRAGDIQ